MHPFKLHVEATFTSSTNKSSRYQIIIVCVVKPPLKIKQFLEGIIIFHCAPKQKFFKGGRY